MSVVSSWTEPAIRVLNERYVQKSPTGQPIETPDDVFKRTALGVAQAEFTWGANDVQVETIAEDFRSLMVEKKFMPNSPTLMNAGKGNRLNWAACFVLPIDDDMSSIFMTMHNAAIVHQSGGGTGFAFSRLRPKNSLVQRTSGVSSGPVSFLQMYNAATEHVKQGGTRRGANMAVLRVDHPDILEFIDCKRAGGVTNFNISVGITHEFMLALLSGGEYNLRAQPGWPMRDGSRAKGGEALGRLAAGYVWDRIVEAAWATGDPGLIFIDRANESRANALPGLQTIETTNPCGEQLLPPYGVCTLGHLNLNRLVDDAFELGELRAATHTAVRFLDDVVEANPYPLPEIKAQAHLERRLGLGVMGWADLLFRLRIPYASARALELAEFLGKHILSFAQEESYRLAEQRGPFPAFEQSIYAGTRPRRNANLTTIAPTGTTSMFADCSSGIEPVFALAFQHKVRQPDGLRTLTFVNEGVRRRYADSPRTLAQIEITGHMPETCDATDRAVYVTAHEVPPEWHVKHQAVWQAHFSESSISKTINMPNSATVEDVAAAYRQAWDTGCLGITIFRDGCKGSQVLNVGIKTESPAKVEDKVAKIDGGLLLPASNGNGHHAKPQPIMKPRPRALPGRTFQMHTPLGTAYVTITEHEGEPFETFVHVGKAGSDTMACAEALGRLISTTLRMASPMSPRQRLVEIQGQLQRIGGAQPTGLGPARVLSLPDAISRVLGDYLGQQADPAPTRGVDLCPECGAAGLSFQEGCVKCLTCSYTRC